MSENNRPKESELERFFLPASEEIEQDNRFILQGRRPLRSYPLVWLTLGQLDAILEDMTDSGFSQKDISRAFMVAQGRLESYQMDGRNLARVNVLEWFFGWIKQQLLEAKNAELKVKSKLSS